MASVGKGKTVIEFSGNAGQVRNAFHTEIHKFVVNGEEHFANVSDPAIPEALSPVVAGVAALHNFRKHSYIRKERNLPPVQRLRASCSRCLRLEIRRVRGRPGRL